MKSVLFLLVCFSHALTLQAQRGFNYYKDSSRVGSPSGKAYAYFKKAYYEHIWQWTKEGADSAAYYLHLAIKEDSNYAAAYAFLAHVYQFQTYDGRDMDRKKALQKKYAEKAVSYNPKTGDAYSVLSDVKWEERDTAAAFYLLHKAMEQEPDNVGNYIFMAIRFTQQQSANDSAIYYLHQLIALDPEYGQAYIKMGNIYSWNLHRYDSAKHYYRKAIAVYNNVQPRDNRMMDAYYWMGNVFTAEQQFDSAVHYYGLLLRELEPSRMYIREARLGLAYRGLYQAHRALAQKHLGQLLELSKTQVAKNPSDARLLYEILQEHYVPIEADSIDNRYALPLARRIQKMPASDPNLEVFAVYQEAMLLTRLRKKQEAFKVLERFHAKAPHEPVTLFELGRMKIAANDTKAGLFYLQQARQHLNHIVTKGAFLEELKAPDFDKVRQLPAFKKLLE